MLSKYVRICLDHPNTLHAATQPSLILGKSIFAIVVMILFRGPNAFKIWKDLTSYLENDVRIMNPKTMVRSCLKDSQGTEGLCQETSWQDIAQTCNPLPHLRKRELCTHVTSSLYSTGSRYLCMIIILQFQIPTPVKDEIEKEIGQRWGILT